MDIVHLEAEKEKVGEIWNARAEVEFLKYAHLKSRFISGFFVFTEEYLRFNEKRSRITVTSFNLERLFK